MPATYRVYRNWSYNVTVKDPGSVEKERKYLVITERGIKC